MKLFGSSNKSSSPPTEDGPPETEETTPSGDIFSRLGMGKSNQKKADDNEDGGLECTSYNAMKDTPKDDGEKEVPKKKTDLSIKLSNSSQPDAIPRDDESKASAFRSMVSSVLPKVAPLPWTTFFCLSVWCAIPAIVYILLFTQMGYGESFYYALSNKFGGYAYIFAGILLISGFLFYILDVGEWHSAIGNIFRFTCMAGMFVVFVIIIMLVSNEHPFGLIALFALLNPLWMLMVKSIFYRSRDARTFVSWLSGPLLFISLLTAASFIAWICLDYDNEWNSVTRVEAAIRTGCEPNYNEYPNCQNADGSGATCFYVDYSTHPQELAFPDNCDSACLNVYNDCANGFILFSGPILMCLSMLFLAFFCTFLRTEGTNENDIFNFGKLWFFLLFIMWTASSLSGAAAGITSSLMTLTLASLVGASIFLMASFSKEEQKHNQEALLARIHDKYGNNLDVVRGLFVVTCSPIVIAYFCLSAINQLVRRIGINPCAQPSCEINQNAGVVTTRAKKQLASMRSWDRAKVFTYAVYWGIAFMILQVLVANLTVVFLSWMIEKTADFGLAAVTAIMAGVGVMMFLLPPVPGVPVYLTLGIVLSAQGHEVLGWVGSIAYSTGIGLVLKLFSSALQQKMIGENLSHFVSVRQFVGINSTLMKAMRLVLGKEGICVSKVSILIGGPDWPTSVLAGIMRLKLLQIMIGTLPIVFLIFPTVLTGALLYMTSLETDTGNPMFPWAGTVSTISASVTAFVQFGSMIVAAYYLEQAAVKRADEVAAIEDDKEVKEADDRDEHMRQCYENVTQWPAMPLWPKMVLTCSLASITASCYMVQFFSDLCFVEHSLTDSIDENLGGNVGNLFLPLGWAAVGLFGASSILLGMFTSWWGKRQAKVLAESGKAVSLKKSADIA